MILVVPASSIGAYDAKVHFAELLQRVESGEEVTITRHGKPVARVVPMQRKATPEERRAAIAAYRKIAAGISLKGLRVKDLIAEGRR